MKRVARSYLIVAVAGLLVALAILLRTRHREIPAPRESRASPAVATPKPSAPAESQREPSTVAAAMQGVPAPRAGDAKQATFTPDHAFGRSSVIEERTIPTGDPLKVMRVRVLESKFKYPFVRVEEESVRDPASGGEQVVRRTEMVADHVMVKLKPGIPENELAALVERHGAAIRRKMSAPGLYIVELRRHDIDAVTDAIAVFTRESASIAYAEPDYIVHAISTIPNDPQFASLWGMHNTGQTGGTPDADIDAPEAWDIATGSRSVLVGVIDTGIDYTHDDLATNAWTNPGESGAGREANGVDDDGNGFIDDVHGWDFVNGDNNPMDDHSHGTHVSGTIGAAGNNGLGVAGVNWAVSIAGIKFLSAYGSGSLSDAIEAVYYGTTIGVRLTSNSWGGGGFSQGLLDAIEDARQHGILFIAAAGNSSSDNDYYDSYPSGYSNDNIIAVAALDDDDLMAYFSSYGLTTVDLGAPGVAVNSTLPGDTYGSYSGTSMATPHVSGVAALILSLNPGLTYAQVKQVILAGTVPIPALSGRCVTGGKLNAYNSLIQLGMMVVSSDPPNGALLFSRPTDFRITFTDPMNQSSLDVSDFRINGTTANAYMIDDSNVVVFMYDASPVTNQGEQVMAMAADAVFRQSDGDGLHPWSATFRYDELALAVTSAAPADGSVVAPPMSSLALSFNEPIDPASADAGDLSISQGEVAGVDVLDSRTVRFNLSGVTDEATVSVALPAGALTDLYGNPSLPYAASYILDVASSPFAGEFEPVAPHGGLVYESSVNAFINPASDEDRFLLPLDGTQTLAVVVRPEGSLKPVILLMQDAQVLGSVTAATAGATAYVQAAQVPAAGECALVVSGADGSTGSYEIEVILNAALEPESFGVASNDTQAAAQDIDAWATSLGGGAARVAVLGRGYGAAVADGFGYTAGPDVMQFEDISTSGVPMLAGVDDDYALLPAAQLAGFEFDFYGVRRSNVFVTSNGLITFDGSTAAYFNENLGANPYMAAIAAFWDDLYITGGTNSAVYWQLKGSGSSQRLIVQWNNVSFYGAIGQGVVTFQAILQEDSDHIIVNYLDLDTGAFNNGGASATVGLKDAGPQGVNRLLVSFNSAENPLVGTGKAILFGILESHDDWYTFAATAGVPVTVAVSGRGGSAPDTELYDSDGALITQGRRDAANVGTLIDHVVPPSSGPYYIRLVSTRSDYTLLLTRGVAFEKESNSRSSQALDISGRAGVLGALRNSGILYGVEWMNPTPVNLLSLDPETAEILDRRAAPPTPVTNPFGFNLAFDGTHLWFNDGTYYGYNRVYKIDFESGTVVDSFTPSVPLLGGLGWCGGELFGSDSYYIYVFDDQTYALKRTLAPAWDYAITGLAGDDARGVIWAVSQYNTIYKIDPQTGTILATGPSLNQAYEQGLAVVGDELFVSETYGIGVQNEIAVYNVETLAPVRRMPVGVTTMIAGLGGDGAGGAEEDWYRVRVRAGDVVTLTTRTPMGDPQEPFAAHNVADPMIELYDDGGALLAADNNSAPDGKNARLVRTVGQDGAYRVRVRDASETGGEYVLGIEGATGGLPPFDVVSTTPSNLAFLVTAPTQITVRLSDTVLLTTVQASDLLVDGVPSTSVTSQDGDTLNFAQPALGEGLHTVSIAPGALLDLQATPIAAYNGYFVLDATAPRVTVCTLAQNAVVPEGNLTIVIQFSESIASAQLDGFDFTLVGASTGARLPASYSTFAGGTTLSIAYTNIADDIYAFALLSGSNQFEDAAGNDLDGSPSSPLPSGDGVPGGNFVVNFSADIGSKVIASPLVPVPPRGGLVYQGTAGATITAGDADSFTVALDPSQKISVVVTPAATLRPQAQVFGPGGQLASGSASAAGRELVVTDVGAAAAGTYTITISGVSNSTGSYAVQLLLNASAETENRGGPSNNVLASAQNIGGSYLALTGQVGRFAVAGRSDGSGSGAVGPDGFGNGAAGQAIQFEDISTSGIPTMVGYDDGYVELSVAMLGGFEFNFYGARRTNLFISSNGLITFGAGNANFINYDLIYYPDEATIAAFWDDLYITGDYNSAVYWQVKGSGSSQRLIVQWNNVSFYGGIGLGVITFQAILYEDSNRILVNYRDLDSGAYNSGGASATIGLKDIGTQGTNRLLVSHLTGTNPLVRTGVGLLMGPNTLQSDTPDFYAFTLAQGDRVSLAGAMTGGGSLQVDLLGPSSNVIASGTGAYDNVQSAVRDAAVPATTTYYARVRGTGGSEYALVVVRNAAFDLEPNDTTEQAQSIALSGNAIGALSPYYEADVYSFHLATGDQITAQTRTPGDGPREFANTLDPSLQLLDPDGVQVAFNDNSAPDGRNALVAYTATRAGAYRLAVRTYGYNVGGEYVLAVEGLGSQPPVLRPIADQVAAVGQTLRFDVIADVANNEPVTLSAQGLPPFASLASTGAAGVCTFIPQAGQEGSMYTVTFTATNGNGGDARTIAMVVTDVAPSNMLRNGDFESPTWSTTYFDYWTTWGSAGREPWAARAGSFGAYFPTWSAGSTAGAYQDLYYPPRGTYTFSLWVRLEPNISPVVLDLKLEWFNYNYSNLQPASVTSLMGLPRDGGWHHVFVTGTCTSTALAVMRPVLYAEWATPGSGPAALMFDDAALYSGAYVGVRSLANPGFEEAYLTSWRGSRWYATPENTSGGREPWAARSGTNGAAFYGWLQESNTFAAAVQQNLTPRPGTFIFSGWLKREMNFQPTNSELRLEWYDATFTNKVQPDTVRNIALTNDGLWHFVAVTGSCTAAGFRELRPTVAVQWNRNPTNWTAAGMLDDMQLSYIDHAWDSDGDGLPDWWELVRFNGVTSAMAGADNDGDSMNNAREFRAGTDPTDASSLFEVIEGVPLENGDVMISWSSQSGVTYRVERATNLLHGFSVFRAGIPATPPVNVFVDTNQAPQLKLYRICVE